MNTRMSAGLGTVFGDSIREVIYREALRPRRTFNPYNHRHMVAWLPVRSPYFTSEDTCYCLDAPELLPLGGSRDEDDQWTHREQS